MSNIFTSLGTVFLLLAAVTHAVAVENEFHGDFRAQYDSSSFNRTPTTDYNAAGGGYYDPSGVKKGQNTSNFVEQRSTITYTAKANEELKLVTTFELNYAYWGNSESSTGNGSGGAVGARSVNLVTKSLYLDSSPITNVSVKIGMMPIIDAYKGVLFNDDMAGVSASGEFARFTPTIGYFRLEDKGAQYDKALGLNTRDLLMIDGKYKVSKDFKIGATYYLLRDVTPNGASTEIVPATPDRIITVNDIYGNPYSFSLPGTGSPAVTVPNYNDISLHVLGLNGEFIKGPWLLNGFIVYETGTNNGRQTSAFAGNLGARYKASKGTARVEFLYVSGDSNSSGSSTAFYSAPGGYGYRANEMAILGRDKNALMTDNAVVFNADNRGQGHVGVYLGYDRPFTPKFDTALNLGFAWVAKENSLKPYIYSDGQITTSKNSSDFLGSELNSEANYKVSDNLKLSLRAAYAILGEYYLGVALQNPPMNVYDAKLIVKYQF